MTNNVFLVPVIIGKSVGASNAGFKSRSYIIQALHHEVIN